MRNASTSRGMQRDHFLRTCRQQIKLFTFLVGQRELLAQKTALQIAGKTQIVALKLC
jgi:hypothetical protein